MLAVSSTGVLPAESVMAQPLGSPDAPAGHTVRTVSNRAYTSAVSHTTWRISTKCRETDKNDGALFSIAGRLASIAGFTAAGRDARAVHQSRRSASFPPASG